MDGERIVIGWTMRPFSESFQKIADAHNAALAAERETTRQIKTAWDELSIAHGQLQHELAAEREKMQQWILNYDLAIHREQQLREQRDEAIRLLEYKERELAALEGVLADDTGKAALDAAIAEARKPLVDALRECQSSLRDGLEFIDAALAKVKEGK